MPETVAREQRFEFREFVALHSFTPLRACKNLIRTLPALPYSASHPEDVASNCDDHCYDALRYALG
jgi:hypothetical protein